MFIRYIQRFYFPVFCALAAVVYVTQHYSVGVPVWVNNYLNDLLCMPIVLKISQTAVRYIKSDRKLKIPLRISLTLTLFYAVYFEFVLPQFQSRYTADPIDVVLYFLGLLFFVWIEGKEIDRRTIK